MSAGRLKREYKSKAKIRSVDLKIGKKGITTNLIKEAEFILNREGIVKFSLLAKKDIRNEQIRKIEDLLNVQVISVVGKTASFTNNF